MINYTNKNLSELKTAPMVNNRRDVLLKKIFMRNLTKVINQLTEKEIKLVDSIFELNVNRNNSKKKELFSLIQNKNNSRNEALRKIYSFHHPEGPAGKTARRLMSDLCNAMLLGGEDMCRRGNLRNELKCRRKIIISEILFQKEFYFEAGQYLLGAMKIAKASELYSEQITIYRNYMSNYIFYGESYPIMKMDIKMVEELNKETSNCEILYNEIRQNWYSGIAPSENKIKKWQSKLSTGENTVMNRSARISYYSSWTQIFMALYTGENDLGCKAAQNIFKILKESEVFNYEKLLLPVYGVSAALQMRNENKTGAVKNMAKIKPAEIPVYLSDDPFALENIFLTALATGKEKKQRLLLTLR